MKRHFFTLAAVSATCLIAGSALAATDTSSTTMTTTAVDQNTPGIANTVMDVTQFRDQLNRVHDLFTQIRENHRLALAAQDPMVQSTYTTDNRGLMNKAMGILDTFTAQWRRDQLPNLPGQTASMNAGDSRFGTADAARYAAESDDTAFVRNTVWTLDDRLKADKLNGRDPVISNRMMSMLDAAIARAQNPDFRVAQVVDMSKLNQIDLNSNTETTNETTTTTAPPAPEPAPAPPTTTEQQETNTTTTNETTTTPAPAPTPAPETTTNETTNETTTTTGNMGGANLPQTGGDPGMLFFLGSGLAGLGMFIRKRS